MLTKPTLPILIVAVAGSIATLYAPRQPLNHVLLALIVAGSLWAIWAAGMTEWWAAQERTRFRSLGSKILDRVSRLEVMVAKQTGDQVIPVPTAEVDVPKAGWWKRFWRGLRRGFVGGD